MNSITDIIDSKILEYEKKKVLLLLDQDQHTDMQLIYLTEALWDNVHSTVDQELPKSIDLEQRAEIHHDIEVILWRRGWTVMYEFLGLWLREKYDFALPEQRYTEFNQIIYK
jgi:hypothetical protein